MKNIRTIITAILAGFIAVSCSKDEESAFQGSDNYITSFALVQGDAKYYATITRDSVIVSLYENVSLEEITPQVVLSENSTISPEPGSITDWESQATFTVTAYNGRQRTYKYELKRLPLIQPGNITLTTQADVEAFAASGISVVEGSLNIAQSVNDDTIKSLVGLSKLKSVKYGVNIGSAYAGRNLEGLGNLETAQSVTIGSGSRTSMKKLTGISLPALKTVSNAFTVAAYAVKNMDMPVLKTVGGKLSIDADSLYNCHAPDLEEVAGEFRIWYSKNYSTIAFPKLRKINAMTFSSLTRTSVAEFPALEEVTGRIYMASMGALNKIDMPALQTVGSIDISGSVPGGLDMRSLTSVDGAVSISSITGAIDFSSLERVQGNFYVPARSDFRFLRSLKTAGTLTVNVTENCQSLAGLENLTHIEGNLSILGVYAGNAALADLSALESLTSVGGTFSIEQLPQLTSLSGLKSLSSTGLLYIRNVGITHFTSATLPASLKQVASLSILENRLEELNISGMGVKTLNLEAMKEKEIKLTNDGSVLDLLYIQACKQITCSGMNQVTMLRFMVNGASGLNTVVSGIKEVATADLYHGATSLTMPDLEDVQGQLKVYGNSTNLPKLKHAGEILGNTAWKCNLPELTTIDGNCTIPTSYGTSSVEEINLPKLKTIGGTLRIAGYSNSASYRNTKLTNLNGLSSLTSVKAVSIVNNNVLKDYSGLKNALSSFTAADWTVGYNGYNPTYQELVEGKFTESKP
ncbi:MAG: hypothetical protein AB2L24_23090 [Mangrovibacterium sp.]